MQRRVGEEEGGRWIQQGEQVAVRKNHSMKLLLFVHAKIQVYKYT